jgi:hypothetical protein
MADYPLINRVMPKTVGELAGFEIEIRCPKCGRVASIEPKRLTSAAGRALNHLMALPKFLTRLKCTASACGAKPDALHARSRTPSGGFGIPASPWRHWTMDRRGNWTFHGEQDE